MKLKLYALMAIALCIAGGNLNAQNTFPATGRVGIGTTSPNASTLLEIKSTSKGILIPRMTRAQRDAIGSPAVSLLIYQTDIAPGFYYYGGSGWKAVTPATGWLLTGNSGTSSSAFLGTTDAKPLIFKTNNTPVMRITSTGSVGIGSTLPVGKLNVDGGATLSLSNPGYAVIGNITNYNLSLDNEQIQARYNGTYSNLYLNNYGGYTVAGNSANSYYGLLGYGSNYGLYGYASSSTASGVYGTGYYGVYGSGTYGVYGSGSTYGVRALSSSGPGLYASSTSGDGLYTSSTSGYGIYSYSGSSIGVYGSSGSYIGVYGYTGSSSSYAGYFGGNVYCSGTYLGSDEKLKQNIKDVTSAMDIINQLHPKFYNYRQDGNYKLMNLPTGQHYGLIAQDVEKVLPNLVKETHFNTADAPASVNQSAVADMKTSKDSITTTAMDKQLAQSQSKRSGEEIDFKAVNYTEFIPILIKGMQEQQQQIDALKKQVQALSGNTSISDNLNTATVKSINLTSASLLQNVPNPLKNSTSIQYNLPEKFSNAQLIITDNNGKTIKQINVTGTGKGSLNVDASLLSSGTYNYSLIVDGRMIESKKMIVSK